MTDVMKEIMGNSEQTPSNEELEEISKLANTQLDLELQMNRAEDALAAIRDQLRKVQEELLPEAMINCGLMEFRLTNGMKIRIKEDTHPSIRKDFLVEAIDWLDSNNLGGIVKDDVSVKFGRGEKSNATMLMEFCKASGFNAEEKLSVHPMTLKATVKEQMANGVVFPEEFFSVYSSRKAEIKLK